MRTFLRFTGTFLSGRVPALIFIWLVPATLAAQTLSRHAAASLTTASVASDHRQGRLLQMNSQSTQSLRQALNQLERKYNVIFGYPNDLIDYQTVSSNDWLQHAEADAAIKALLKPFNLTFEKVGKNTFLILSERDARERRSNTTQADDEYTDATSTFSPAFSVEDAIVETNVAVFTVTGQVLSETKEPLPGANVILKGTTVGTTTDAEGRFTLALPDGSENGTLIFSFIGYRTEEVAVAGRNVINMTMAPDVTSLNEVVVVGFGTQKKVNLTGAVSTIESRTIENRPVTNAIGALQGTATGVIVQRNTGQPGFEEYSIQVRGLSSVNGGQPLVWVDGAPGSLNNINPNDIESISVLKDAAATAIYGARAAGGVILVTTKRGKSDKITVDFTSLYGLQRAIRVPERLNSWEEAEMANLSRVNAGQQPAFTDEEVQWMRDPSVEYVVDPTNANRYRYYYNFDRMDAALRETTPSQNHNVSLRGGDDKSSFFASFGYFRQEGIFKVGNDMTDRYNARLNYDRKFSKMMSIETRFGYNQRNVDAPSANASNDYGVLMRLYTRRRNEPIYLPETNDTQYAAGLDEAYANLKDGGRATTRGDEFNSVITLKATDIVKGLTLRGVYSPQYITENRNIFRRTVQRFERFNRVADLINPTNSIEKQRRATFTNSLQFLADYDLQIKNKHNFHVLAGYSFEDYRMDFTGATGRNLASNDIASLDLGNPAQSSISDDIQTWALLSYFGRLNYNFDERYLFEFNLRYDGSSKLAPTNRWQLFPSFSAAWRVSQESWFEGLRDVVNELKVRGSWGRVGNSDGVIGNYDFIPAIERRTQWSGGPAMDYPFNQTNRGVAYFQRVLASDQKTWETVETSNIGLDLGLLNQRLTLSGDYFVKRNIDMLAPVQVPATIGIETSTYNVGSMRTWGWEVSLGWRDNLSPSFSYFVNGNFSDYKNEVTSYNGQIGVQAGLNRLVEGRPFNSIFGYIADGYFTTRDEVTAHAFQNSRTGPGDLRFRDIDNSGVINSGNGQDGNSGDVVYLGNTQPRMVYGFDFGFNVKGFDFSAFFQGVGKRNTLMIAEQIVPFVETWRMPWDINTDYWTPENTDARFPRLFVNDRHNTLPSTHWIMNAAYLRLKNLQIGYTLPQALTRRAKLERVRVFFSGQDLWEISRMWNKYYDPESPNSTNSSGGANLVSYHYPFFRTYSAGLNLTF